MPKSGDVEKFDGVFERQAIFVVAGIVSRAASLHCVTDVSVRTIPILFLLLCAVQIADLSFARADYDVVVDIDWTILSPIHEADRVGRTDLIFFGGQSYAPAPHMLRALEQLLLYPDVRLHIFSGGEKLRNRAVLEMLKTSNGKNLLEQIEARGGQIWSATDLTPIADTGRIIDRFRKRVESLLVTFNPTRLILIDDQIKFGDGAMKAIPSFGIFNDRQKFDSTKSGLAYEPVSEADWSSERERWVVLSALLDEAFRVDRSGEMTFRDFLLRETRNLGLGTKTWKAWFAQGRHLVVPEIEAKSCESLFRI